jgi:hypothetical protein
MNLHQVLAIAAFCAAFGQLIKVFEWIYPNRKAISSGQVTRIPCLCSRIWTQWLACIGSSIEPCEPATQHLDEQVLFTSVISSSPRSRLGQARGSRTGQVAVAVVAARSARAIGDARSGAAAASRSVKLNAARVVPVRSDEVPTVRSDRSIRDWIWAAAEPRIGQGEIRLYSAVFGYATNIE